MPTLTEHMGSALDERIRILVSNRTWYRSHREKYPWTDLERDNDRELRTLLRVRAEGRRRDRVERVRDLHDLDRLWAAHEAAEAAMWAASVSQGRYITLPDVPLAGVLAGGEGEYVIESVGLVDKGDHFAGRTA